MSVLDDELVSEIAACKHGFTGRRYDGRERITLNFFNKLCEACCHSALKEVKGGMEMETAIYSLKGQLLGRAVGIDSIDEINWNRG